MKVFVVEYINKDCFGDQCLTSMEIVAPNLDTAYGLVDINYPELAVDCIYPQ